MLARPARLRIASGVAALLVVLSGAGSADAAPATAGSARQAARGDDGPQGYLVDTLPDITTVSDDYADGSIFLKPGAAKVHVGKTSIHTGFEILFKTGGKVTYGVQEQINGKWYDMMSLTKGDPRDGCAMGGAGWNIQAAAPGKVKVRGFSRQDGKRVVTPAYEVTIKKRS